MRRDWQGRRTIVTGASGGIGEAIARRLAARGARLVLAARSADALQGVARDIRDAGGESVVQMTDITIPEQRDALVARAEREFGGLDLLVNNAGIGAWGHFASSTEDVMRRVMEVNFFGPIEVTRAALPLLRQGNAPAIATVTSMCARRAMPAWPEYSASKFGLVGFLDALRGEMARFGVGVLTIVPGLTRTGLQDHLIRKDGRYPIETEEALAPDAVAEAVERAVERDRRETVVGTDARQMLLLNRFAPRLLDRLIARKISRLYADS